MDLIRRIFKISGAALVPAAAASFLFGNWRIPAGIIAGGLIALLNIKGLAWGVQGMLGSDKATAGMLFFSQFRFVMILVLLSVIAYLGIVNIIGLLIGFSIVFAVVLIEGYRNSGETIKNYKKGG